MRGIRTIAAAVFAAGTLALAAAPASAQEGVVVTPILECVFRSADGTSIAVWGYQNDNKEAVEVAIGSIPNNRFDPSPQGRGQPTKFEVGRRYNVFTTSYSTTTLAWKLTGVTAIANGNSRACEKPPVPQGNDSPQAFVLIAAIAGGIAIVGGASGFALRRRRRTA